MKFFKKKLIPVLLCLLILFAAVQATAYSAYDGLTGTYDTAASSQDDEGLTWSLVFGTLTLSGSGYMPDYSMTFAPWYESRGSIRKVVIEEGVLSISGLAFYDCKNLTEVSLPSTLKRIEAGAFHSCSSLSSITIPKETEQISWYPFAYCTSLKSINVESGNSSYISDSGILFSASGDLLLQYPVGKSGSEYTVPASVDEVGMGAFAGSTKLKKVVLSKSLKYVESYVFSGCKNLESVAIGRKVQEICEDAFEDCSSLKDIYYEGSEYDWMSVSIESGNSAVNSAKKHYYSTDVFDSGSAPVKPDSSPDFEQTVDYRSTVNITVDFESAALPPLFSIALYDEEGNLLSRGANYKVTYKATNLTRDRVFYLKVLTLFGTPLNLNGSDCFMTIKLDVKNGFFNRIGAFFKMLFGALPEYSWELKYNGPQFEG